MYQLMLVLLVVAAILQLWKKDAKLNKIFFVLLTGTLIFMQFFRYGQGSDYWGYCRIYAAAPFKRGFLIDWYKCDVHAEAGFKFLINIFTALGLPSILFYGIFNTFLIAFVIYAIKQYSPYGNVSLMLFYPTFYLSYVLSGVRQAMVTAIFLAFGLKLLHKRKYLYYFLLVLVCATIHSMALFFLILLPIKWIKEKWIVLCVPIAWIGGLLVMLTPIHTWLGMLPGLGRLATVELSIGGLGERTLMFGIISFLYWYGEKKNETISFLYKIYGIGYLVAMAGMVTAYGSQRITMSFKAVEILLIPMLLAECGKVLYRKAIMLAVAGISVIMTLKNLHFYTEEYNAFTYPYRTIWTDKNEEDLELESVVKEWEKKFDDAYELIRLDKLGLLEE